jgi:hypothetical protein
MKLSSYHRSDKAYGRVHKTVTGGILRLLSCERRLRFSFLSDSTSSSFCCSSTSSSVIYFCMSVSSLRFFTTTCQHPNNPHTHRLKSLVHIFVTSFTAGFITASPHLCVDLTKILLDRAECVHSHSLVVYRLRNSWRKEYAPSRVSPGVSFRSQSNFTLS